MDLPLMLNLSMTQVCQLKPYRLVGKVHSDPNDPNDPKNADPKNDPNGTYLSAFRLIF